MKSLIQLHGELIQDLGQQSRVSTHLDRKTIESRVSKEGISFLTITLPTFSKDFERSLEQRRVTSDLFLSFKKQKGTCLPAFLQGFTSCVFDPLSGLLKDDPDPLAIFAVRQITLFAKKVELPTTPRRQRAAFEQFLLTDLDVASWEATAPEHYFLEFGLHAKYLFGPVLDGLERALTSDPNIVVPRHGPGATADRTSANAKYDKLIWTQRLEQHFKSANFIIPSWNFEERFLEVEHKATRNEPPVRVISVPKTLKTPRIIAIEPVHTQYVQQGLMELLVRKLEGRAMHDSLGFSDQSRNRDMALTSSVNQEFATLDLSEASDRVSNQLVECLLSAWPTLSSMVQACRSKTADVPGHGVHTLSKFASMGSALCFPIEAMVFLTLVHLSKRRVSSSQLFTGRSAFLKRVRVYGDDIIVPIDMTQSVIDCLEDFGLKVNRHKSFWNGNFRESCGGDYYNGVDVKPVYLRRVLSYSRHQAEEMISTVSLRNQLYKAGLWRTVSYLDSQIERVAPFPFVGDMSPVLGRHTFLPVSGDKQDDALHRPLVRGLVAVSKPGPSPISGAGALMKYFLKRGDEPFFSKEHLQRDGRPKSVDLRLRWAPVL